MKRLMLAAIVVAIGIGAGACSSPSNTALDRSLGPLPKTATSTTTTTGPTTTTSPDHHCDPSASFAPEPGTPMPSVDAIQRRGKLVVGVDQGTKDWGYRDPSTGDLTGLEVDLLQRIADSILPENAGNNLEFKTLTTAQRIDAVREHQVDMVASLLTATCERWKEVDFSSTYFVTRQALMVDKNSKIESAADLAGRRVCATQGSTSIMQLGQIAPKAIPYPVAARADCVVALQEGDVDAITSDETILQSFQQQENTPLTRIIELPESPAVPAEPYAIAIPSDQQDLVRKVNGVLEQMREDGSLQRLYQKWLNANAPSTVPTATYR